MKLTGAALCMAAFIFMGTAYLENEKRKLTACLGLYEALMIMKTELRQRLLPLRELMQNAAEGSEGGVKRFFQYVLSGFDRIGNEDFAAIWSEAAEKCFDFFSTEQLRSLCLPGAVLGKSAGETQAEALEDTARYFKAEGERIKEKMPGTGKLAIGLSACAGLLTVIVLY